jgi:hypothetical protein
MPAHHGTRQPCATGSYEGHQRACRRGQKRGCRCPAACPTGSPMAAAVMPTAQRQTRGGVGPEHAHPPSGPGASPRPNSRPHPAVTPCQSCIVPIKPGTPRPLRAAPTRRALIQPTSPLAPARPPSASLPARRSRGLTGMPAPWTLHPRTRRRAALGQRSLTPRAAATRRCSVTSQARRNSSRHSSSSSIPWRRTLSWAHHTPSSLARACTPRPLRQSPRSTSNTISSRSSSTCGTPFLRV